MAPIITMTGPKTPHGKETTAAEVMQNIKVFVRCRPLKLNEKKNVIEVFPDRKEVRINESKNSNERYNSKTFTFDNTFNTETTQLDVYRSVVEPLIEQVVMGYNCTVFAYGQTGTGKTYTMEGERSTNDSDCSWEEDPIAGIIPRALHQLFESLQTENAEHTVRVSFLELYNEELYDLLSPIDDTTKLKIFEDTTRKGSVIVGGLEEITVHSKAEIYEILKKGSAKRQTAATLLNACSSRSHTIFSVTVHIKENAIDGEDLVKIGKLNLVDLAGSENIGRSGAIDKRAREAGNINQSLLTLGRVITSLVDRTPHIPYRESKLTRLLQESLGGRTKTSIIATISPNIADADDTLSTLEYAQRAKKITNKPEINQKMSKKTLLREYTAEIERLRRDLAACREKNGIYVDQDNFNQMEQQIKDQIQDIEEKSGQIQALSEEISRIQQLFDETKVELEVTSNSLKFTSEKLTETVRDLNETRNDRDEQKHLVQTHVSSEKVLSTQAKQLLNVAEVTTSAVGKLHEKVDRQRNVETNNWSKTNDFKAKFVEEMKHLEDLVSITNTSYNDSLDEMKNSMITNIKSVETIAKEAQNKVISLNDIWSEHKSQFSTIFTKDRIILEQCLSLKDTNQQIETSGDQSFAKVLASVECTQKAIFEDIEKINQIVAQQRQEVEEVVMKQNTQIERITKITVKSFEATKKDLELVFDKQNEEMSSIITRLEELNDANATAHEDIDHQIDDFENVIKSQLQKLNDIKIERIRARVEAEKANQEVSDRLKQTSNNRINSLAELKSKFEAFVIEIDCEEKSGLQLIAMIDELNTDKTQQLMNTLNELNTKNTSLPNEVKDMVIESKELLSQRCSQMNSLANDSINNCNKQLSAKQMALKSVDTSLVEKIEEQKVVMNDIASNMKQISDCVYDKTSEMIRMAETMEKSQKREIENRCNSFESFVKNDLIRDVPTGTTPQKTSYSFPTDLVQTSPHDRILERFRLARAVTTPLPEEYESEILSDSSISLKSFDSLPSNDENIKPLTDNQKRKKVGLSSKLKTKEVSAKDSSFAAEKRSQTPKPLATNLNN